MVDSIHLARVNLILKGTASILDSVERENWRQVIAAAATIRLTALQLANIKERKEQNGAT